MNRQRLTAVAFGSPRGTPSPAALARVSPLPQAGEEGRAPGPRPRPPEALYSAATLRRALGFAATESPAPDPSLVREGRRSGFK